MPVEERRRTILRLLANSELALPPMVVYINLRLEGYTFGERTVKRHLYDMLDEGLVGHPDLRDDYYQITEEGRTYLEDADTE